MSTDPNCEEAAVAPEIEGWTVKYIGNEPRLSEQVELFRDLGFETRIAVNEGKKPKDRWRLTKTKPLIENSK